MCLIVAKIDPDELFIQTIAKHEESLQLASKYITCNFRLYAFVLPVSFSMYGDDIIPNKISSLFLEQCFMNYQVCNRYVIKHVRNIHKNTKYHINVIFYRRCSFWWRPRSIFRSKSNLIWQQQLTKNTHASYSMVSSNYVMVMQIQSFGLIVILIRTHRNISHNSNQFCTFLHSFDVL